MESIRKLSESRGLSANHYPKQDVRYYEFLINHKNILTDKNLKEGSF